MAKKKEEVAPEVTKESKSVNKFKCANCEDSGKECVVCLAGKEVSF